MPAFTKEQVEEHAKVIVDSLEDGFQWTDILGIVPRVMEIVDRVEGMTGEEKAETAAELIDYVIDETDIPWVPDDLVDPLLKQGARALIPIICKLTKGEFKIN